MPGSEVAKQQVRKHVATIHIKGDLSLVERKIVNALLLNAYDKLLDVRVHSIPVSILSMMVGWEISNNTDGLERALTKIISTPVQFNLLNDGKKAWAGATLVAFASIANGVCTYQYADWLAERLANPDIYAIINISIQRQFSGSYALTMYENCQRFKGTGSTGWIAVDTWRRLLGAEAPMYDEFKHFSNHVIKKAAAEVNAISDITITPEYQREARKVSKIRFLVEEKSQRSLHEASTNNEIAEIKESDLFRRIIAIGLGEKLAINLIQQDAERALAAVNLVEQKIRSGELKASSGGYLRVVFDSGSALDKSPIEKQQAAAAAKGRAAAAKQDKAEKAREAAAAARDKQINAAIKALPLEQRQQFAQSYLAGEGGKMGKSYRGETAEFKNALERVAFTTWLRGQIAARDA